MRHWLLQYVTEWRTWWDLAAIAFLIASLSLLLRLAIPHALLVMQWGFLGSIVLFFIGFVCLHWTQESSRSSQ